MFGRRSDIMHGNNVHTEYTYNQDNSLLSQVKVTGSSGNYMNSYLDFDKTANLLRKNNTAAEIDRMNVYEYDKLNRLVKDTLYDTQDQGSAYVPQDNDRKYMHSFSYSHNGNILKREEHSYNTATGGLENRKIFDYTSYGSTTHSPHAVQQIALTEFPDTGSSTFKTFEFDYDPNGNMTQKTIDSDNDKKYEYTWNENNFMQSYRELDPDDNDAIIKQTDFEYDESGERIKKQVSDSHTTYYVSGVCQIINPHDDTPTRNYFIFDGVKRVAAVDVTHNDATYFYHTDHVGSTSLITTQSGDPYKQVMYKGFGEFTDTYFNYNVDAGGNTLGWTP